MSIEWRIVPGYEKHEVSEDGRLRRRYSISAWKAGHELKPSPDKDGYLRFNLGPAGGNVILHRLVALAFIGPQPAPGYEVSHNDGNNQNNHWKNLRWATRIENENDKFRHGTHNMGEHHGCAKLTGKEVIDIREKLKIAGTTQKSLAVEYKVTTTQINRIALGKSWKHLLVAA